jgi:membrane-bound lytic murein transglycosylase D
MAAAETPAAEIPPPLLPAEAEPPLEKAVKNTTPEPQAAKKAAAPLIPPAIVDSGSTIDWVVAFPNEFRPNFEIIIVDVRVKPLGQVDGMPMGQIRVEIEETLGHYAEWANVLIQKIRAVNDLRFNQAVHLGRKIKIPLLRRTAKEFAEQRYEFHKRLQEDFFAVYRVGQTQPYQVQAGDNFWNLCRNKFEIPMWLLQHCNPDVDLSQLSLPQTLLIPTIEKSTGDKPGAGAPDEEAIEGAQ